MSTVSLLVPLVAVASPSQRSAREFLVDAPHTTWTYDGPQFVRNFEVRTGTGKRPDGTIQIEVVDDTGHPSLLGWRLDRGAWIESLSARGKDVVILPAILKVGTEWQWDYTDLLGYSGTHYFVVESVADTVTLEDDARVTNCLRVRETRPDLGKDLPVMHWFVAGKGEVAQKVGSQWLLSISKFASPKP